ncbi:MAG: LCP family protein, partial [Mycobacterium sp.]|nr:LCP family protein [Mycobacterium sp.]
MIALAAVSVLGASGVGWFTTHNVRQGLTTSRVLASQPHHSLGSDQNILVMGLDSRLDEQGKPLPEALYKALHAGSPDDGGNNANVLMVIHIPGNGSKATAISIPRDDYTELSGCPDNQCQGKIKQAYGLAFDEKAKNMPSGIEPGTQEFEQAARDAGRKAEIDTVSAFLGGVPIDHFVEVTLAAFYEVAQVVAPVTVCVNENTADAFSGAHFHQGSQELDAASAVAFVRQRRDTETGIDFSDLDRERRQQAFIVSLSHKLSQTGTLTDPAKLAQIYDVAKANTAIDSGFDPIGFATNSSAVTSGNASFLTLPIDHFGQTDDGESINVVDPDTIHTIV